MGARYSCLALLGGSILVVGCGNSAGGASQAAAGATARSGQGGGTEKATLGGTSVVQGGGTGPHASGSTAAPSSAIGGSSVSAGGRSDPGSASTVIGGRAASGGTSAVTSSAGQAGMVGAHCAPNEPYSFTEAGKHEKSCYVDPVVFQIPNPSAVFSVRDFALPNPMVANVPYAISEVVKGYGPLSLELWGTDSECGKGKELLWWAPMMSGIVCAEFIPTAAHSHVLAVLRQLKDADFLHYHQELGLCPAGTCPAGACGNGLAPGKALSAPLGGYATGSGMSNYRTSDASIPGGGQLTLVSPSGRSALTVGEVRALSHGVFRMASTDPAFGDAWYCLGEGSTMTQLDEKNATISFKNITRLADCSKKTGSNTAMLEIAEYRATVTSTLAELVGTDLNSNQRCVTQLCRFSVSAAPKFTWLGLRTAQDLGTNSAPTRVNADVVEAEWLVQESDDAPFRMACATTGNVLYDPEATTKVTLSNVSSFVSCPGEAIANNTLEIALQ